MRLALATKVGQEVTIRMTADLGALEVRLWEDINDKIATASSVMSSRLEALGNFANHMITVPAQFDKMRTARSPYSDMVVAAKDESEFALPKAHDANQLTTRIQTEAQYHEVRMKIMEDTMDALRSSNTH